jgi:hypothetical protein
VRSKRTRAYSLNARKKYVPSIKEEKGEEDNKSEKEGEKRNWKKSKHKKNNIKKEVRENEVYSQNVNM